MAYLRQSVHVLSLDCGCVPATRRVIEVDQAACFGDHHHVVYAKDSLGKLFISHSSVDKAKVRTLDKKLRADGYDTWLDEREIEVGDALAARISEGVSAAKIVLVVVSEASLSSNWLRYELDIATERMIAGHCRVIPVLIDDVPVPRELEGRLYADMRPGRRGGFKRILRALEAEASKYPHPTVEPSMAADSSWHRTLAYQKFLGELAGDGFYQGSLEVSATRSIDVEGVNIGEQDVQVNIVHAYGFSEGALSRHDFDDWRRFVTEDAGASYGLLISERPIETALAAELGLSDRVGSSHTTSAYGPTEVLVVADLSEDLVDAQARDILTRAYELLAVAVSTASA